MSLIFLQCCNDFFLKITIEAVNVGFMPFYCEILSMLFFDSGLNTDFCFGAVSVLVPFQFLGNFKMKPVSCFFYLLLDL